MSRLNSPGFSCVRRAGVGFKMLVEYALVVNEQVFNLCVKECWIGITFAKR